MSATETEIEPQTATSASFPRHRLTVDRYLAMVEAGIFGEDEPVFLWHGELVEKMTKGRRHSIAATKLDRILDRLPIEGFYVEHEQPMAIHDDGAPEPDLTVIRGSIDDYPDRWPTSRDVALVVEVADSSLAVDSGEVLETYAAAGIPVYWIVDIRHRRIEVCAGPSGPGEPATYRERRSYGRGEEVPVMLDGREVGRVAIDAILPGAS